jgi:uncharacterized protein (DUF433 family)
MEAENTMTSYISYNAKNEPVITGTRAKVRMIAEDHVFHGWDAQEIHEQYPYLTIAQIHAALASYYDHKAELDAEMRRVDQDVDRLKAAIDQTQGPSPLQARRPDPENWVYQ